MSKKFRHLDLSPHWQQYFSKYPQGYTIIENLIDWVSQVDDMVDNVNDWNEYLIEFVETFDTNLQTKVTETLSDWQNSGFLDVVISEALQWQLDEYIATNEQDKLSFTAYVDTEIERLDQKDEDITTQLAETENDLSDTKNDLTDTQTELTDTKNELNSIVETQEIILNVGDNEEFKTLNSALIAATKYTSRQLEENQKIVILLKSGFILKEQILVDGLNLGHIKLKSEDSEVVISRQYIVEDYGLGYNPVFYFTNNSTSFVIDVLFNMDNTGGDIVATAFYVRNNSRITFEYFAGCKNASRRGLHCSMNSRAVANNTIFTNSGEVGIRSGNGSQITCENTDVSNSHWGISSTRSTIDASNIVADGCTVGVGCNGNSTVSVDGGSFLNSGKAFEVRNVSSLFADNATIETENSATIQTGSRVSLESATISSVQPAISMTNSQLVAPRSTFTGSDYSISASSNSVVTLNNATYNRLTLGSGTLANLNGSETTFTGGVTLNFVHGGNIVNAFNAELEFSTLTIGEWFSGGIIYK